MTTHGAGSERRFAGPFEPASPLAERIVDQIAARANGRTHGLQVVRSGAAIILQGRSRTYHAKQLAQEAALDLIDVEGMSLFLNQIVVA